ncbi:MAG TPA: hypothetical protein VGQ51_16005 [Puia sp.]|jgi:hypothetical protein|nr:hypothetical protein [Puia sp.]
MPTIQTNCALQALFFFTLTLSSRAQPRQPDSISSPAAARAALYYQSYIGANAAIYNGCVYQQTYIGVEGSPYFLSDNLTDGSVVYEDLPYTHLLLLYNTVLDQPVLADRQGRLLSLPNGKVSQFTIDGHIFIHLSAGNIPSGYYELLRSGYATLLLRHTKRLEEKLGGEIRRYITSQENYYVYKNGHYYSFGSVNGLISLLSDKQQQLQRYRRSEHIRFRKDPLTAAERLIDYYNQLPR